MRYSRTPWARHGSVTAFFPPRSVSALRHGDALRENTATLAHMHTLLQYYNYRMHSSTPQTLRGIRVCLCARVWLSIYKALSAISVHLSAMVLSDVPISYDREGRGTARERMEGNGGRTESRDAVGVRNVKNTRSDLP